MSLKLGTLCPACLADDATSQRKMIEVMRYDSPGPVAERLSEPQDVYRCAGCRFEESHAPTTEPPASTLTDPAGS